MITSVQENMKVKVTNSEIREGMRPLLEITANTTDEDILVKFEHDNLRRATNKLHHHTVAILLLVGKLFVSSKMTLCNEQLPAGQICTRS